MSAGKSSRFKNRPKILETFNYNCNIFKKYFNEVFIVTTKEIYPQINSLNANFIISNNFGRGSGIDVINLYKKINNTFYIAWSDVFFKEQNIIDIININNNENTITLTYRKKPYVDITISNNYAIAYTQKCIKEHGFQDNSIFFIKELNVKNRPNEFLDILKEKPFKVIRVKESTLYFNTEEELKIIKKSI
jgi:GTP:adenosylcobinamide-phosphate guanylyltransferase